MQDWLATSNFVHINGTVSWVFFDYFAACAMCMKENIEEYRYPKYSQSIAITSLNVLGDHLLFDSSY